MENIPASIFNLIEKQDFDTLSDSEKELVLEHLSEQKYQSYRYTATLLTQSADPMPVLNIHRKNELMDRFMHHNRTHIWNSPIPVWKAASIVLLLGAGWLIHWQTYQQSKISYITQLDTVYLEKEVQVKVYDTVYYKEESAVSYASQKNQEKSTRLNNQNHHEMNMPAERKRRGVSAKDDSLIQSFKFVTL